MGYSLDFQKPTDVDSYRLTLASRSWQLLVMSAGRWAWGKAFFFFFLLTSLACDPCGPALIRRDDLVLTCGLLWIRAGPTVGKVELSIKL